VKALLRRLASRAPVSPVTDARTQHASDYESLLNLGRASFEGGRVEEAARILERASAARPDALDALAYLALALQRLARWQEACTVVRRLIGLRPDWDQAHNMLGVLLQRMGETAAARKSFERALALNPASAEALSNLASALLDAGDSAGAAELYRRALQLQPDSAALLVNLGLAEKRQDRLTEAARCFERAIAADSGNVDAWVNMGATRAALHDDAAAARCFEQALSRDAHCVAARANLALTLARLRSFDDARAHLDAVGALESEHVDVTLSVIEAQRLCGRMDAALRTCDAALQSHPGDAALMTARGAIVQARGDLDPAEACFRQACAAAPSLHAARYNLATLRLLRGDYREGFALYESRFDAFDADASPYRGVNDALGADRRWRGESLNGRRLLLWAEQGFGDTIMMMRYLPLLRAAGASTIVVCDSSLVGLVRAIDGAEDVLPRADIANPPPYDVHCPLMSLPHLMGTTSSCVPSPCAVNLPAAQVQQWRKRLSDDARPRVGVVWRGGAALRDDHLRNVPFSLVEPILGEARIGFVSLQKTHEERSPRLTDWMDECFDFLDTACLVSGLDLVISVDTAVAHLAASLGTPTWLLNRHGSEWRWGVDGERSAWYPAMRIFRQRTASDWSETLTRVRDALVEHACLQWKSR
jgi:tetratricopeptide (TPR) repeat protein